MNDKLEDVVVVKLPRVVALTLFEWSLRFAESHELRFSRPSEPIAIDRLANALEWALPETREKSYPESLKAANDRVERDYREHMGEKYSAWLDQFDYRDE